jgi:hypothetical protein
VIFPKTLLENERKDSFINKINFKILFFKLVTRLIKELFKGFQIGGQCQPFKASRYLTKFPMVLQDVIVKTYPNFCPKNII